MDNELVQVTLALSEPVITRVDELVSGMELRSRSALIDQLLREVLFDDESATDVFYSADAS
jgi:metal-responsive CopG/Arc/MetJ family transcriptional regulator